MSACPCLAARRPGCARTDAARVLSGPLKPGPLVQRVSAGHGLDWIVAGWGYFSRMLRPAMVLTAVLLAITLLALALSSLRYASTLLSMLAVFYLALISHNSNLLSQGAPLPRLAEQREIMRSKPLWIIAAIAGAITLALDFFSNSMGVYSRAASWSGLGLYFLFVKLLSLVAMMALWLAPTLVMLDDRAPLQALKLSLLASLKNFLPWLLFSLLAFVFCIVAALPLGLGLLAALPVLACAAFLAWRDIFT